MLCPRCGTDNLEGMERCGECGASLDGESRGATGDLVSVLVTNDAASLAIAKSLLDAEGIECEVQGESGQEALGLGPLPGATGPLRLMVAPRDEEAARGLLAQVDLGAATNE